MVVAATTYQQLQIASDIDGEAAGDQFGYAVSMSGDGNTFVVGARLNNGINGSDSGHVRIYTFNPLLMQYVQVGSDIEGEAASDRSGSSVSISADGSTFVIGAVENDGSSATNTNTGHVRVYTFLPLLKQYVQFGSDIDGEGISDAFGFSVSMSADGTTFVVGANRNGGNGLASGHVRAYKLNSTIKNYVQVGLDIDGESSFNQFGSSVSISADGTTFVVGAILSNGINGNSTGHVRVFKFNSTINGYAQFGSDIDGEASLDQFGYSVSISADGSTFVVGANQNNGINGTDSGHVRVYKYNLTINDYVQVGLDIDGEAAGDNFGFSVSMSGDGTTFAVGAPGNRGINGTDSGHVRFYKYNSITNNYAQIGMDIDGEATGDDFGYSVSMSVDGSTLVVGAIDSTSANGVRSGHVRVYKNTKLPTLSPTKIPTKAPVTAPTRAPVKVPSKAPVRVPTRAPVTIPLTVSPTTAPENCGLLGWNWFCPRRGKCGLVKRLLKLGNCD